MLQLSSNLFNRRVMSLRSGSPTAIAAEPIINPHNLKIIGWWCDIPGVASRQVLLAEEVREITPKGLVVNDDDALCPPEDLVRHKETLEINYQLMDKTVKTKRQKLGKVSDYSYNDGMFVQKLYVARPLMRVFSADDTSIIDRTQILEVADDYILVKDTDIKATEEELAGAASPIVPA